MQNADEKLMEVVAGLFTLAMVALVVMLTWPKPSYVLEDRPAAPNSPVTQEVTA